MYQRYKLAAICLLAVMTSAVYADVPEVSNVTMTQIEHTRNMRITYDLAVTNAIIMLSIETNGVALPDEAVVTLIGDVNQMVAPGKDREIIWQAGQDWMGNITHKARARITAWYQYNPPYCAVDLRLGNTATNYPVKYYASPNAVPRSVTDSRYKTFYMLFRLIEATGDEGYTMGSPEGEAWRDATREEEVQVFLTKPFYIGVYQVTQRQWYQVMKTSPSRFSKSGDMRPVERVSYHMIRGDVEGVKWPGIVDGGDHSVDTNSFLGLLRDKTNNFLFDLPTEAQWEYACRAGSTGPYNVNASHTQWGRHNYSGGTLSGTYDVFPEEGGTSIVGSYLSNAWGLYDMHGNIYEHCLDWRDDVQEWYRPGGSNLVGAVTGTRRIIRGGKYDSSLVDCRSAARESVAPSPASQYPNYGFRLALHLP